MRRHVRLPIAVHDPAPITHGSMTPVRVVLHDTESHDRGGKSDIAGIFQFFRDQGEGYGVHFITDADGLIGQGGQPNQIQWHVGNLNTGSIGIEQIGFASFTELIWSRQRRKQLWATARVIAWAHGEYGIPMKVRRNPQLPGVTTHARVGAAGIDTSGHTDPGKGFPLALLLMMAHSIYHLGFADAVRSRPGK